MSRIIIIDKHPILRLGLINLFENNLNELEIIQIDSYDSFENVIQHRPDLIIWGVNETEKTDPIYKENKIKKLFSSVPVIIYDIHTGYSNVLTYLKLGTMGYLSKRDSEEIIIECIHTVLKGRRFISPAMKDIMAQSFLNDVIPRRVRLKSSLSNREHEIAIYLSKGEKTSFIANYLNLKCSTISTVKSKIFKKLSVDNVIELRASLNNMHENIL